MTGSPDTRPLASVPDTMPMSFTEARMEGRFVQVLKPLLLMLLAGLPVLLILSVLAGDSIRESGALAVMIGLIALMYWLLDRGRVYLVSHLLVFSLIAYTATGIWAFGSVRSAGAIGFAGAIVAAGMMLRRTALAMAVLASAAALGVLTWAEHAGRMRAPDFSVGLKFWATHVIVLVAVAIAVRSARRMVRQALVEQRIELGRRERAEQDLRLSEDRFSRIFRNSPVAIIVQAVGDGTVLDINPAFERLYGYSRAEFVGSTNDVVLWASQDERTAFIKSLENSRRITNFLCKGLKKDGGLFDAMVSCELEGAGPGRIVVSNIADVSVSVQAQEAARQSQELFTKAFDYSPVHMSISRVSDGTFLAVNATETSVQGYSPAEMVGRNSLDTGTWLNPGDRDDFIAALRAEGKLMGYGTQMRHKDGHLVDTQIWAVIVEIGGESCVLASTINISDQKRREQQLLELARGVAGETGERFFKLLAQHLANALEADMAIVGEIQDGESIRSLALVADGGLQPPMSYPLTGTPCADALSASGPCFWRDDISSRFPDDPLLGGNRYRAYIGIALRDADGTPIGILNAVWRQAQPDSADRDALFSIFASRANAELIRLRRDREIQHLNETLEQRVKDRTGELQASNAELESFSYSVSHDLKAPLSSIDGFTALLLRRMGPRMDAEEQRMFERIRTNVGRMHELITALLSLAQVSRYRLELQEVDLSAMAQECFDAERALEPQREVQTVVQPGLTARCDRRMARIVLENLLGNAWKYTRKNPQARIEFGVAGTGTAAEILVRDNGVGFDMAHAGHLFKPFHRLHNVSEYDGSGIGLATVHRILERHGGHIRAESTVGQGASFLFSFEPQRDVR
ncbi:MAG: PAS domain S-box protein [Pseudomonadota bacterium]